MRNTILIGILVALCQLSNGHSTLRHFNKDQPRDEQSILQCVLKTEVKQKFLPVCGSNKVTYANLERLVSANSCGLDVELHKMGVCQTLADLTNSINRLEVDICVRLCPVPAVSSPMCGTNGQTYTNVQQLECAQRCGHDLRLQSLGSCASDILPTSPPISFDSCMASCAIPGLMRPVCGSDGVTYTNQAQLNCAIKCSLNVTMLSLGACGSYILPNNSSTSFGTCMVSCTIAGIMRPVCGSDGVTYTNQAQLNCAIKCGLNVTMLSLGACASDILPTSPPISFDSCMASCAIPGLMRPVCGSDGVTYTNQAQLNCAIKCSLNVTMLSLGACGSYILPNNSSTSFGTCMVSCTIAGIMRPVCGSDGVTYTNQAQLNCAIKCGLNVTMLSLGACASNVLPTSPPMSFDTCMASCAIPGLMSPVCGSDGVTYTNQAQLNCAQKCGADVNLMTNQTCPGPDPNGTIQIDYRFGP